MKRKRKQGPKSCKHIDTVIDHMSGQGVYVTANDPPFFYCAVCKVEREMEAHGSVELPERKS